VAKSKKKLTTLSLVSHAYYNIIPSVAY